SRPARAVRSSRREASRQRFELTRVTAVSAAPVVQPIRLASRGCQAGTFTIADIAMANVLRLVDRSDALATYPACREYVARATVRPAFLEIPRRPDCA